MKITNKFHQRYGRFNSQSFLVTAPQNPAKKRKISSVTTVLTQLALLNLDLKKKKELRGSEGIFFSKAARLHLKEVPQTTSNIRST